MAGPERRAFFCATAAALVPLIGAYMLMTAYRSFRDYFAPEIYSAALGREPTAVDYLVADWPGGLVATAAVSALVKIPDNKRAVIWMFRGMIAGAALLAVITFLFQVQLIAPLLWASASTGCLMIMYTPTGSFMYDRLLSATKTAGTSTFLVFISDGLAYLCVGAVLVIKSVAAHDGEGYDRIFIRFSYFVATAAIVLLIMPMLWVARNVASGGYGKLTGKDPPEDIELELDRESI